MNAEQTTFLNIFGEGLDPKNRWMALKDIVPWDELERTLDEVDRSDERMGGRPPVPVRVALGSLIIKEVLGVTDRETVAQIQENPYLQAFLGFASFSSAKPFDASSMVHFRKRFGADLINAMNRLVVQQFQERSGAGAPSADDDDAVSDDDEHRGGPAGRSGQSGERSGSGGDSGPTGTLMLDASCAPADITHPDDLGLLNHAREITERVIDCCHSAAAGSARKPRTYRNRARADFLRATKRKRSTAGQKRQAKRRQLQFIRRNLRHIDRHLGAGSWSLAACTPLLRQYLDTVRTVFDQQWTMYAERTATVENRIYNIAQPHVRAIRRSKPGRRFEWGAKVSASYADGFAFIEHLQWDPYNETADLIGAVETYRAWHGHYPERVLADKIYRTRANRNWCRDHGIRLAGIGPGRPPSDPDLRAAMAKDARQDESDRQPMEGVFGRGKRRFSMGRIMTKLAGTSETAIAMVFLVMNLLRIVEVFALISALWCWLQVTLNRAQRFLGNGSGALMADGRMAGVSAVVRTV